MWPRMLRRSFTLVELIIVITIIAIMAAALLSALAGALEDAKEARTRAQIAKLHELIMEKWVAYQTRALPIRLGVANFAAGNSLPIGPEPFVDTNQNGYWDSGETYTDRNGNGNYNFECFAFFRLVSLHDLMRLELPDRMTDLTDSPLEPWYRFNSAAANWWGAPRPPSIWLSYRRRAGMPVVPAPASWPTTTALSAPFNNYTFQGAECLYLIASQTRDGDTSALDFYTPDEIGDVDNDGLKEILDGWGNPIEFVRWPAGFATQPGLDGQWGVVGVDDDGNGTVDDIKEIGWIGSDDRSEMMIRRPADAPDPFNPFGAAPAGFAMFPLIFSAGRDGAYDIFTDEGTNPIHYMSFPSASRGMPDDPYFTLTVGSQVLQIGKPMDANGNGELEFGDNITNHALAGT